MTFYFVNFPFIFGSQLLLTGTSEHKVEKIKMAGWTYMAACGLDPNRRESLDSMYPKTEYNSPYNKAVVLTMVEFAAAMMMQLQTFNRGSFQSFEGLNLRIGKLRKKPKIAINTKP